MEVVMQLGSLKIEKRAETGGGRAKRLLEHGKVPAVVYGGNKPSEATMINKSELKKFLKINGKNSVFNTEFAQEQDIPLLIKDIQLDPVNKEIVHVDIMRLNPNEKVQVNVPLKINNLSNLKGTGCEVIKQMDSVTVECLPGDIPQYTEVDISGLNSSNVFTAGDLKLPGSVSLVTGADKVLFTVKRRGKAEDLDTDES
jgi:large subunit ribosomal protein L25